VILNPQTVHYTIRLEIEKPNRSLTPGLTEKQQDFATQYHGVMAAMWEYLKKLEGKKKGSGFKAPKERQRCSHAEMKVLER
jgi:hypothetical protein